MTESQMAARSWTRIAHRGASGVAPEHTKSAFIAACRLGAQMIELDVHLAADGQLIVIHDAELNRTTNGSGLVREQRADWVRSLDAGTWFGPEFAGEPVLTLAEVVDLVPPSVALNVEIKSPDDDWQETARQLLLTLDAAKRTRSTIVSSFMPGALRAMREVSSQLALGVLTCTPDPSEGFEVATELQATALHPFFGFVGEELVSQARGRGLKVNVWTVNEPDDIRAMVALGVDGIISDYPDRLLAAWGQCG